MAVHAPTIRRAIAIALATLAVGTLAACGSDDDSGTTSGAANAGATSGGGASGYGGAASGSTTPESTTPKTTETGGVAGASATKLTIDAVETSPEQLAWSRRALSSRPGDVTIALSNPSGNQLPHAVEVEGAGVEQESAIIQPGDETSVTAELRPGRYTFYCPVGNHRELGMEGTLTVR